MSTTESSAGLRAQVQELRDQAAQLRAAQETTFAGAQAEADRLRAEAESVLTEGRNKAARLMAEAANAERSAEPVEKRAVLLEAAEMLETAIPAAEARVVELYGEAEELGETITSLTTRLTKLGEDREEIAVELAAARQAGDVDGVVAARTRIAAVDEVVTELTSQQRAAQERVVAIGAPDDDRELGKAAELVVKMRTQQRQVLNELHPDRAEAQIDAALQQFADCIEVQYGPFQEQQNPPARHSTVIRN